LAVFIATLLVYGIIGAALPGFTADAAAKKYTVTLTVKMGKQGSSCPYITFTKSGKNYYAQTVSKWYIDGKYVKEPFDVFYGGSGNWKFSKHTVKVVMKKKLPKGKYAVYLDNGSKKKKLGTVTVKSKSVKKTFTFA
jgi:hypothetical protein